jgi:hypothetical protein
MASVPGGHHVVGATAGHGPAELPGHLGAFSLYLITQPQPLGGGQDSVLSGTHDTVEGAPSTGSDTVPSGQGPAPGAPGWDTVTAVTQGLPMAGDTQPATDQVIATQTYHDGNTTLHLPDGSSMTLLGVTQIDSTLFHH